VPEEQEVELESTYEDTPEAFDEVEQEPGETYTIKIDGEESQVTLDELQNGYQRQADYTRKTQELSAERDRLRQAESIVSALETDPEGTLQALQRSFGIELTTPRENEDWEELDPTEQKLLQLEKKIEQQEATQRQQTVEREVNQLQESYGDFDAKELLRHAVKHGISNLEAAYTHWRFGDVKATADKLQQEQEITQKKRDASVITPGGSTQAGTQQTQSDTPASSIREAFALAKKQLST
tara:strand:- start:5822 stop:6541 length:720 start_codon:yes stop_codon:yes gene_type:complete